MNKPLHYTLRLFIVLVAVLLPTATYAFDFHVDGIYYNKKSATEATVTYLSSLSTYNKDAYKGKIIIPEIVSYNGVNYSVTSIGSSAFYNCSSLTSVSIPNSVTSIGSFAFFNCTSLSSVSIGNSVTSIGECAFSGCSALPSITIPNSVTSIGDYTFKDCSSLTSVSIPNSVTSIGSSAFYKCSSLISVSIPNSVTMIDYDTFRDCSSLTSVSIPNSVTSIGSSAFSGCSSLTSVSIPNSVTSIGYRAFLSCGFNEFTFEDGTTDLTVDTPIVARKLYLGRNIYFDSSRGPFMGCSLLSSVSIGNSVTEIRMNAFYKCESLKEVSIGISVTEIGVAAFYGCTALSSITCKAINPPIIYTSSFDDVTYSKAALRVPEWNIDSYKKEWWRFNNVDVSMSDIIEVSDDSDGPFDIYNIRGTLIKRDAVSEDLETLAPDIYVIRGNGVTRKLIIR